MLNMRFFDGTSASTGTTEQIASASRLVWLSLFLYMAPLNLGKRQAKHDAGNAGSLAERIASVLPTPQEESWLQVPWRIDLTQARAEAQRTGKPLFLWIMEGHPLGCT